MKYVLIVLLLAAVGVGLAWSVGAGAAEPVAGPQPGDPVLPSGWGPEELSGIFAVPMRQREAIEAKFEGMWTPAEGWVLTVESATDTAVKAVFTQQRTIGGGFMVICRFGRGHDYGPGARLKVQGVIDQIETLWVAGVPDHRIVLEPVRVVP